MRPLLLVLVFIGTGRPVFAQCDAPRLLGHVVEVRGDWFDGQYQEKIEKGSNVCVDSRLVRRGTLSDDDSLHIQPLKTGAKVVVFACREGVTCLAPLNLNRVPEAIVSSSRLDDVATFLKRVRQDLQDDRVRVRALIHRAPATRRLHETVLLSKNGVVSATDLFATKVAPPLLLELCRVRPGQTCPNPPQSLLWNGAALPLETGFYRVVIGQQDTTGFLRTDDHAYVLVVDSESVHGQLSGLFERARTAAYRNYTDESDANLVTYLYYLGGGYSSASPR